MEYKTGDFVSVVEGYKPLIGKIGVVRDATPNGFLALEFPESFRGAHHCDGQVGGWGYYLWSTDVIPASPPRNLSTLPRNLRAALDQGYRIERFAYSAGYVSRRTVPGDELIYSARGGQLYAACANYKSTRFYIRAYLVKGE